MHSDWLPGFSFSSEFLYLRECEPSSLSSHPCDCQRALSSPGLRGSSLRGGGAVEARFAEGTNASGEQIHSYPTVGESE